MGMSVSAYGTSSAPHVMVIMMENKNFSEVIGQADQPYTNSLATNNGLATASYSMVTGSLPNYLALASGSTQNDTDNVTPAQKDFPSTQTLADQLASAGYSSKAYAENLPANPNANSGQYEVIHVPWLYFPNAPISVADASSLIPDLNSSSAPDFVWYTPNLINDEDTGTVQQGDAFLSTLIPQVQATPWYQAGGKIIIEWDESTNDTSGINGSTGGGRIPTIVVSAGLAAAPQHDATPVDTIGILHSIEDLYGVPNLSGAADPANGNIDSLLNASVAPTTTTTAPTTTTTTAPTTTTTTAPTTTTTTAPTTTTTTAPTTTTTTAPTTTTTTAPTTTTTTAPTTTTTTAPPTTPTTTKTTNSGSGSGSGVVTGSRGGSTGSSKTVSAPSRALAFTGPGLGVGELGVIGGGLLLLGLALLVFFEVPRRLVIHESMVDQNPPRGHEGGSQITPAPSRPGDLWLIPPRS